MADDPLEVVYEAGLFPGPGGGPLHFVGLSGGLRRAGVRTTHVLPRRSAVGDEQVGGDVVRLPSPGGRLLRQATYELSRITLVLWWFVRGRRFDAWVSRQSLVGVGLLLTRLIARRVMVEVNGPLREEILANQQSRRLASIADLALRWQLRAAHTALPVTPGLGDYLRERHAGTDVRVLANGSDRVEGLGPWGHRPRAAVFVGALTPWYELETVLRAIAVERADGHDVPLDVLGDGVRRHELEALAVELGIGDLVAFRGWATPEQVRGALAESRIGVLPLRPKHPDLFAVGSPLKLFEYAAAGLRVVGTQLDGIANSPVSDVVDYYPVGDVAGCAAALRAAGEGGPPQVDADAWSWDGRARELVGLISVRRR